LLKLLASGGVKARAVRADVERPFAQYNEHVEKIRALEREVERLQKQPERKQEPYKPPRYEGQAACGTRVSYDPYYGMWARR
jgi:hypothetical protein